jgi:hypothetical protein
VESYRVDLFDHALSNSLKTIRAAKSRYHFLTARSSTKAVLASQIELCDVLLEEIQSISSSLEKRMIGRSGIGRRSEVARRSRSSAHTAVPSREPVNRSKRRTMALRPRAHKRDKEDVS